MRYEIRGRTNRTPLEVIDSADTMHEAQYLLGEYRLAFGALWDMWIVDTEASLERPQQLQQFD